MSKIQKNMHIVSLWGANRNFQKKNHENLVSSTVVYPHFAEETKTVFAKSHRKRNKFPNGISMISASHGTHQMTIFPHGEIWAVNLVISWLLSKL